MCVVAGKAWITPAVESMMVIQMKNDPIRGAEDLETFGIFCQTIGAIWFCLIGGAIISRPSLGESPEPKIFFVMNLFVALDMFIVALIYPTASEKHGIVGHDDHHGTEDHHDHNHEHHDVPLKDKLYLSFKVLTHWQVKRVVYYIILVTLTMPNFEVFYAYSNEEQHEIKAVFEGSMVVIVYLLQVGYLVLYGSVFINVKNKWFVLTAIFARAGYYYLQAYSVETNISKKDAALAFSMNQIFFAPIW